MCKMCTPININGKLHKTVRIGNQIWMAENLACEVPDSKYYDNNPTKYQKYGRLYNWKTAKELCPIGWDLPSDTEWDILLRFVDGTRGVERHYSSETAGKCLKAKYGWNEYKGISGNGEDTYKFAALPGGKSDRNGNFCDIGNYGYWWSASTYIGNNAYYRRMLFDGDAASCGYIDKSYLYSVRYVKNQLSEPRLDRI